MPRLVLALSPALVLGGLLLVGCSSSAPPAPVAKKGADGGPALPAPRAKASSQGSAIATPAPRSTVRRDSFLRPHRLMAALPLVQGRQ